MVRTKRTRRGATLVEVLVSAAMLILGMWLLVWLYQQGMNSFIQAKSQADITTQERNVATVMTRDLGAATFPSEDNKPNRGVRLADQRTDLAPFGWTPPRAGYFWGRSLPAPTGLGTYTNPNNVYEAFDPDGFPSTRSTDHALAFTVLLPGGPSNQMHCSQLLAPTGNQQLYGTAAEVTYALVYSGRNTAGGVPLFDLMRRQRLTARSSDDTTDYMNAITPFLTTDNVGEVMTYSSALKPNQMLNLLDLTHPSNRLPAPTLAVPQIILPSSARYGEDRLMSNVISFEVKFTGPTSTLASTSGATAWANVGYGAWSCDPNANMWPRPLKGVVNPNTGVQALDNPDFPYDNLPFNGEYDTFTQIGTNWPTNGSTYVATVASPNNPVKQIRVTGVMIRLRAYEPRNQNARQTTIYSSVSN
jgi:hypothetical protein